MKKGPILLAVGFAALVLQVIVGSTGIQGPFIWLSSALCSNLSVVLVAAVAFLGASKRLSWWVKIPGSLAIALAAGFLVYGAAKIVGEDTDIERFYGIQALAQVVGFSFVVGFYFLASSRSQVNSALKSQDNPVNGNRAIV